MAKVREDTLIERIVEVLRKVDKDEFVLIINSSLGTDYTTDDIEWEE